MKIVTDRGMDLAPSQLEGLDITYAPLRFTLNGKSYCQRGGYAAGRVL